MMPGNVSRRHNNMATVRVRTKDNSYLYGQASINDVGNPQMSMNQTSMLWEKKRINQEKLEQFRELKL